MPWPTWDQAAIFAVVMLAAALTTRRLASPFARTTSALTQEVALISFLYMLWRLARQLPLVHEAGAYQRGRDIWELQRFLHLPSELTMERWAMGNDLVARFTVGYYATVHVPSLLLFLAWMWARHRDQYPRWRDALAMTTGACLFLRFIRVAPPRLLPELGFIDLPAKLGTDIYGPVGTGASDQFAAMPSIHVAWAALVALGIWTVSTSRWRWIGPAHLVLTMWAVMATANHWWLDGLVAVGLVLASLWIDDRIRGRVSERRAPTTSAPAPDSPELVATG